MICEFYNKFYNNCIKLPCVIIQHCTHHISHFFHFLRVPSSTSLIDTVRVPSSTSLIDTVRVPSSTSLIDTVTIELDVVQTISVFG